MGKDAQGYSSWLAVGLATTLIGVAFATVQFKVPSIMPMIMESYGMDMTNASLLMTVFTFAPIVLGIPVGILVRRIGPRNQYLVATVLIVIAAVLGAATSDPAVLIASRILEGAAFILGMIAGQVAIQTFVAPQRRGAATGLFGTNIAIGSFIGGALTPTLYASTGLVGVWLIYAGFSVVAAILVAILIGGKPPLRAAEAQTDDRSFGYSDLVKPTILIFLAGFALWNLVSMAVVTFAPTCLQSRGMDATLAGTLSTLPNLLSIIACPIFGMIADRTGKVKPLLILAIVLAAPGCLVILTTTGAVLGVGILLLAISMAVPTLSMIMYPQLLRHPGLIGIGMGVFNIFMSIGQFFGTLEPNLVLGLTQNSWTMVGVSLAVIALVAAVCVALVRMKGDQTAVV